MNKNLIFLIALLFPLALSSSATELGYSKDMYNRNNTFRIGSYDQQGQAIRIPKAKLQILKGKTINSIDFVLGTKNTTDNKIHAFICTSIHGKPIYESDVTISKALTKTRWTLEQPYEVSGNEEELFIGYTTDAKSSRPLVADGSFDIKGYNYALNDTIWQDTYGMLKGSACIFVNIDDNIDFADLIVGKYDFSGYYKAGNNVFNIDLVNAGTAVINSFDAVFTIGGIRKQHHFSNLDIKPHGGYSISLDDIDNGDEGATDLHLMIANVNSGDNDIDMSDNIVDASLFFYPSNMERSVLVEEFTGQDCSGCPNGHVSIENAIEASEAKTGDKIIEVVRHIGYHADIFTMKEDNDYRYFYPDSNYTFAPGVMANRILCNLNPQAPVMSAVYSDEIGTLIDSASFKRPMVSLSLESAFDKTSRTLKVKLRLKPHEMLPPSSVFNVMLVQDSISAYQNNGGADYKHNRVFRGSLTGNSFGLPISKLSPGDITTWDTTTVIPEIIHSSLYTDDMLKEITDSKGNKKQVYAYVSPYTSSTTLIDAEECNIPAIIDNMSIVALVAQFDRNDNSKNQVFNCIETKVGATHCHAAFDTLTNVESVEELSLDNIRIQDGKVVVDGLFDKLFVYNLSGMMMDSSVPLAKGTYIVKTIYKAKCLTKKLLVR